MSHQNGNDIGVEDEEEHARSLGSRVAHSLGEEVDVDQVLQGRLALHFNPQGVPVGSKEAGHEPPLRIGLNTPCRMPSSLPMSLSHSACSRPE